MGNAYGYERNNCKINIDRYKGIMSNRCNTLFYYKYFQGKSSKEKISDKMTF